MNERIEVEHPNGFYGVLYGKSSLKICRGNRTVLHTGKRVVNTKEDLYQLLDDMPRFMEVLGKGKEDA